MEANLLIPVKDSNGTKTNKCAMVGFVDNNDNVIINEKNFGQLVIKELYVLEEEGQNNIIYYDDSPLKDNDGNSIVIKEENIHENEASSKRSSTSSKRSSISSTSSKRSSISSTSSVDFVYEKKVAEANDALLKTIETLHFDDNVKVALYYLAENGQERKYYELFNIYLDEKGIDLLKLGKVIHRSISAIGDDDSVLSQLYREEYQKEDYNFRYVIENLGKIDSYVKEELEIKNEIMSCTQRAIAKSLNIHYTNMDTTKDMTDFMENIVEQGGKFCSDDFDVITKQWHDFFKKKKSVSVSPESEWDEVNNIDKTLFELFVYGGFITNDGKIVTESFGKNYEKFKEYLPILPCAVAISENLNTLKKEDNSEHLETITELNYVGTLNNMKGNAEKSVKEAEHRAEIAEAKLKASRAVDSAAEGLSGMGAAETKAKAAKQQIEESQNIIVNIDSRDIDEKLAKAEGNLETLKENLAKMKTKQKPAGVISGQEKLIDNKQLEIEALNRAKIKYQMEKETQEALIAVLTEKADKLEEEVNAFKEAEKERAAKELERIGKYFAEKIRSLRDKKEKNRNEYINALKAIKEYKDTKIPEAVDKALKEFDIVCEECKKLEKEIDYDDNIARYIKKHLKEYMDDLLQKRIENFYKTEKGKNLVIVQSVIRRHQALNKLKNTKQKDKKIEQSLIQICKENNEKLEKFDVKEYSGLQGRVQKINERLTQKRKVPKFILNRLEKMNTSTFLTNDQGFFEESRESFYSRFNGNDLNMKNYLKRVQKGIDKIVGIDFDNFDKSKDKNIETCEMYIKMVSVIETLNEIDNDFEDLTGIGRVIVRIRGALTTKNENSDAMIASKEDDTHVSYYGCNKLCGKNFIKSMQTGRNSYQSMFMDKYTHWIKDNNTDEISNYIKGATSYDIGNYKLSYGRYTQVFGEDKNTNDIFYDKEKEGKSIKNTIERMFGGGERRFMYNTILFSFGQSGSGKTFTQIGSKRNPDGSRTQPGISLLSLNTIQEYINENPNIVKSIKMYAVQSYRGILYDALKKHKEQINVIYRFPSKGNTVYDEDNNPIYTWKEEQKYKKYLTGNSRGIKKDYKKYLMDNWDKMQFSYDPKTGQGTLFVRQFNDSDIPKPKEKNVNQVGWMPPMTESVEPTILEVRNEITSKHNIQSPQVNAFNAAAKVGGGSSLNDSAFIGPLIRDKYVSYPVSKEEFEIMYETSLRVEMSTTEMSPQKFKEELNKYGESMMLYEIPKEKTAFSRKKSRRSRFGNTEVTNIIDNFEKGIDLTMSNRPTRSTALNPDSSRSHLFIILQIDLEGTDNEGNEKEPIYLTFSDLAGMEDPNTYVEEAKNEGLYISKTLQNKFDFSTILSKYAKGEPVLFTDIGIWTANNVDQNNTRFALKKMKEDGSGPKRDTNNKIPLPLYDPMESKAIYNIMNFTIGGYVQNTEKAPTKILTFINVSGYLYKISLGTTKNDAEAENFRTCGAVAKTLTFATEISGNDQTISGGTRFGQRKKRRKSTTRKKKSTTRKIKKRS